MVFTPCEEPCVINFPASIGPESATIPISYPHPRFAQNLLCKSDRIMFRTFHPNYSFPRRISTNFLVLYLLSTAKRNHRRMKHRKCFVQNGNCCQSSVKIYRVTTASKKVSLTIITPTFGATLLTCLSKSLAVCVLSCLCPQVS